MLSKLSYRYFITICLCVCNYMAFGQSAQASELSDVLVNSDILSEKGYATVKVLSTLEGNGILVLVDNKTHILTNSHILKGSKTATIEILKQNINGYGLNFYQLEKQSLDAEVVFDDPLEDTTLLKITSSLSENTENILHSIAFANIHFNKDDIYSPASVYRIKREKIFWVHNDAILMEKALEPFKVYSIGDLYISGLNKKILIAPIMGRPGMSGGPHYFSNVFTGMISKVSYRGESGVYIIPINELYRIIKTNYFDKNNKIKSYWSDKNTILIEDGSNKIKILNGSDINMAAGDPANGGGDPANGGGDPANGGGDSHGGKYYNITGYQNYSAINYWINNPFQKVTNSLQINDQSVYAIKIRSEKDRYLSPTIATYYYLTNSNIKFDLIFDSQFIETEIYTKRIQSLQSLVYLRIYNKNGNSKYEQLDQVYPRSRFDHSLILDIKKGNEIETKFYKMNKGMRPEPLTKNNNFEAEAITMALPYIANGLNDKNLIELILTKEGKNYSVTKKLPEFITITKNLNSISLADEQLNFKEMLSPSTMLLVSDKYKAVIVFDSENLIKLNRIFIETQNNLFELLPNMPLVEVPR